MNRVELKNKAKELIKGNKWYLWKPLIIIGLVIALIEGIAIGLDYALGFIKEETVEVLGVATTHYSGGIISLIVGIFAGIAETALSIAYAHYILSFIRGKKLEVKDVVDFMKKHWVISFIASLLVGLIIAGCSILLVIPGIIAALGLTYFEEVCADNPDMKAMDIVKKAWNMTNGHKMDLFVLGLSFIGWNFVVGLTFGILAIWVVPYMTITFTLFYEELKK